jgi:F420-dependent oxidoreductase-like protein
MRFGLFIPQGWRLDLAGIDAKVQWPVMRDLAQHAERGPWSSVWVYDHFHTTPVPTDEATHESWTLMAAYGAVTERIRLGQMCSCIGYRNPAHLAKIAATADIVSGGRIEMGIGGGWYEHEWNAYGYGFPRAGLRLDMLDEGVEIMRQMWTTGTATLAGKHYQVDGAIGRPLPLQDGGIPLWIAGGGEKKTLRTAAKYASHTNFDASSPDNFRHKSEVLAQHCKDVGTDFDAITRSSSFNVVIGATEQDVQSRLDWIEAHYRPLIPAERAEGNLNNYRNGLAGTPEQIVERLRAARELGMSYAICYFADAAYDRSSIELFETQVIPALAD